MTTSTWTEEKGVFAVLLTDASGNAVFDIDTSLFASPSAHDQMMKVWVIAMAGDASGGHLHSAAVLETEGVYWSHGSPVTFAVLTASSNSVNPLNSDTASFADAHAQAVDASIIGATSTVKLTTTGEKIRATVNIKSPGGGPLQNISVRLRWRLERQGYT